MDIYGLGPLPRGWEAKIEPKLGRVYYINHTVKSTTWDDPRLATILPPPYNVAITQPTAYFEDTVGLNSRWSSPVPSLRGFSLHRRGSSPRLSGSPRIAPSPTPLLKKGTATTASSSHLEHALGSAGAAHRSGLVSSILHSHSGTHKGPEHHVQLQEKPIVLLAPDFTESGSGSRPGSSASHRVPPLSHLISCDSETAYRTVCALFPTASDVHVRHLFHKYHNRANVVVSALQVEKYPLCLDGAPILSGSSPPREEVQILHGDGDTDTILSIPDTKSIGLSIGASASPARTGTPLSFVKTNQSSVGSLFTRSWGSPILSTQHSPKGPPPGLATKSPHLKLKYIRNIFPGADDGVLLEVLQSCENNVQKATESLLRRGFSKTPPPKPARQKWLEVKSLIEKRQRALESQRLVNFAHEIRGEPQESPFPTPIMKTARPHPSAQDKLKARLYLVDKFPTLPERFLSWALEASEFNKEKAERLLGEMTPGTPEEFKAFIGTPAAAPKAKPEPVSMNNNVDALNMKNLQRVLGFGADGDTPDSGYYEISSRYLSVRDRRKHFLSNLFHFRSKSTPTYVASSKRAKGPNMSLAQGSNPGLLGTKYIQTLGSGATGANPNSKGANPSLRLGPQGRALGPNPIYARGSQFLNKLTKNLHPANNSASGPVQVKVTGY